MMSSEQQGVNINAISWLRTQHAFTGIFVGAIWGEYFASIIGTNPHDGSYRRMQLV